MRRFRVFSLAATSLALLTVMSAPAKAAPSHSPAARVYSDAAFTFTYPGGWTRISSAVLQQLESPLAGYKQEFHLTDAGGVSNGPGLSLGAAIVVVRLRLSPAFRLQVKRNRGVFVQSILGGIALMARRVLHRGPTTIAGHAANEIEFIQGGGTVRLHQRVYVLLSSDAKRVFVVDFTARKRSWAQFLPAFTAAAASMRFSPSP
jgi:hypothetical protein